MAAIYGEDHDHVPLTTWCFGPAAPPDLQWVGDGEQVEHWYSLRMEHIHTLPLPWRLADDFRRVMAWQSLGVDDVLDVSVPWGTHPAVGVRDAVYPAEPGPIMERIYETPAGVLRHAVRKTREELPTGWVVQPARVPLIEDFNIPRAAVKALGPTQRFILHPVDALFPDTPFTGVERLIECWKESR